VSAPAGPFPWTEAAVEALKALWSDGLTCSEIARDLHGQFGGNPSRNGVVGKVHRLGLSNRQAGRKPPVKMPRRPRPTVERMTNCGNRFSRQEVEVPPPLPVLITGEDIPADQRRSLLKIGTNECHWPFGEPGHADFFYCGAVVNEKTYCAFHARLARSTSHTPYYERRRSTR
jgi:GcrA cell cycle regulator